MKQGETVDNLIRSALRVDVRSEEPAPEVRDSVLAAASEANTRSALGPAIPPLAMGLQECADPDDALNEPVMTVIPLARKQLLLLSAPVYAVR